MSTPSPKPSTRGRRGLPLTGITLLAALLLAGCGDTESDATSEQNDDAGQVEQDTAAEDQEGSQEEGSGPDSAQEPFATAEITDMASNGIGTVSFTEVEAGVLVEAEVHDLQAGFRGIAIHERGVCEPQSTSESGIFGDFESSGAHLVGQVDEDNGIVEGEEAPESSEPNLDDLSEEDPVQEPAPVDHPDHAGDLPNVLVNEDGTGWLSLVTDRLVPDELLDGEGTSVIVHAAADNHANIPDRYNGYGADLESLVTGDSGSRIACGVIEEE